jgi:hypothetical protein
LKIKQGFILREIAGTFIVVPIGQRVIEFNGLLKLNESCAILWKGLERGAEMRELIEELKTEYNIKGNEAETDVKDFINFLSQRGMLN